jgi:hypothetical protein
MPTTGSISLHIYSENAAVHWANKQMLHFVQNHNALRCLAMKPTVVLSVAKDLIGFVLDSAVRERSFVQHDKAFH